MKTGAGTQALGANNSYIGGTSIHGGTLQVDADSSLGDQRTAVTINGGTLKAGAGGIVIQRDVQLGANGGTIEGGFTLTGIIDGPGGLTKSGNNALVLGGSAPNTYAGKTTINAGTAASLIVAKNKALGDTPKGTTVNPGAALGFQNVTYTVKEPVTISGDGPVLTVGGKPVGAIYNVDVKGNTSSFAGPVTLAANGTIGAASMTSLTFTDKVDKAGNVLTQAAGAGAKLIFMGGIVDSKAGANAGMMIDGDIAGKVILPAPARTTDRHWSSLARWRSTTPPVRGQATAR